MVDDGVKLAKRTVIQALTREKGEATADRLLYAYRLLAERFKDIPVQALFYFEIRI